MSESRHPYYRTRREAREAAAQMNHSVLSHRVAPVPNEQRNLQEFLLWQQGLKWRLKPLAVPRNTAVAQPVPGTSTRARVELGLHPVRPIKEAARV